VKVVQERIGISGAQSQAAVNTSITRIAHTGLVLESIPQGIGRSSIAVAQGVGQVNNVSADSMSRAGVGANSSLASGALVSIEANTLS
jgi:hypothetical protein